MSKWMPFAFLFYGVITMVVVYGSILLKQNHDSSIRCEVVARCYEKKSIEECWDLEQRLCQELHSNDR